MRRWLAALITTQIVLVLAVGCVIAPRDRDEARDTLRRMAPGFCLIFIPGFVAASVLRKEHRD